MTDQTPAPASEPDPLLPPSWTDLRPRQPSPLGAVLARLDAEVEARRYAPPTVRDSDLPPRLARVLGLCQQLRAEYPALKAALAAHGDVEQACEIVRAAVLIDYFAERLATACAPLIPSSWSAR